MTWWQKFVRFVKEAASLVLYNAKVKQRLAWDNYEIGFTGNGPTAFDRKPDFPNPTLPAWVERLLKDARERVAKLRQEAWRKSVLEVTGEDIYETY